MGGRGGDVSDGPTVTAPGLLSSLSLSQCLELSAFLLL
jgi:hypothetical protein